MPKFNLSFREDIKKEMKKEALICCGGNVSQYVQRLHLERNEKFQLSREEFEKVVKKAVSETIKPILKDCKKEKS